MNSAKCQIQLVDTRTQQPVEPNWKPTVELDELDSANARMEKAGSPMRWRQIASDLGTLAPSYGM
jgi:hypothetical protein